MAPSKGCFRMSKLPVFLLLLGILFASEAFPFQVPGCSNPIEYGNRNQTDYGPYSVRSISGVVISEIGTPAKRVGPIPACLGLFTEDRHILVASASADPEGRFRFGSTPAGNYRLVVRDRQNAFCIANVPLRVVRWPSGTTKPLTIHMRPVGIDDCSYGAFK